MPLARLASQGQLAVLEISFPVATRRPDQIRHVRRGIAHNDFGVADGRGVLAMHADRIRAGRWRVGCVEGAKPVEIRHGLVSEADLESLAPAFFRPGFIEAR